MCLHYTPRNTPYLVGPTMSKSMFSAISADVTPQSRAGSTQAPTIVTTTVISTVGKNLTKSLQIRDINGFDLTPLDKPITNSATSAHLRRLGASVVIGGS
ncbi:Hypothetical predicted protein [Octopus vulgaris]|uniref:Uncharacterized protein n=1 Tax=Octopus vulgaris TaxID=6645 RepID=A0AA36B7K0_OCTVU|nr:Hypothetical predicted protein [Octopus vulgaris]